jgi:ADP-heptose:LPS heptosyltransferase
VLLAPGASCEARRYDPLRFADVARILSEECRLPSVLVGGPTEEHLAKLVLENGASGHITSLVGKTSVSEFAGVVRRAELVIANNSGPMHFADALGRPVVATYSGTDYEEQWAPRRSPSRILRRPTSCSPCFSFRCPYHMECLDIPAAEVAAAAIDLLRTTGAVGASG